MPRVMEIRIELSGLGQAVSGLNQLAGSAGQIAGNLQRAGAGGGSGRGGGSSGSRGSVTGAGGGIGNGPLARLWQAQANLAHLQQSGETGVGIFDAKYQVARAKAAQERALRFLNPQEPSFGQRLADLVGTTRLGFGKGGLQAAPLINRIGALAGAEGALLTKLAGPIGITVAALGALSASVQRATEHLTALRDAGTVSGGGPRDVAALVSRGLRPDDLSGIADAFRDRIRTDPLATAEALRAGLPAGALVDPKLGGIQNNARLLEQALQYLESITDATDRLTAAHRLELQSLLPLLDVSERVRKARLQDADVAGKLLGDKQATQAAKDLEASTGRLRANWDLLNSTMSAPYIKLGADAMGLLADGVRNIAEGSKVDTNTWFKESPLDIVRNLIPGTDLARRFTQGSGKDDRQTTALERLTDAMNRLGHWLTRPGSFGGGPRAQRTAEYANRWAWASTRDPEAKWGHPGMGFF